MDTPLLIRPKLWLLLGSIAAILLVPMVLNFVPNPFDNLAPGERPSRFFMFLWVALPILMLAGVWRLLSWRTYRVTRECVEAHGVFGAKRFACADLTSSELDAPTGMPPAYELRFGKRKIRFIAAHHDRAKIQALKTLIAR